MPASDSDGLSADWFDNNIYSGCLALSLVLPDQLPLEGIFPISIVDEFFDNRGGGAPILAGSWMVCPYTIMTKWVQRPWAIQPVLEDYSIAEQVLNNATGAVSDAARDDLPRSVGQRRSVVVVVLPVKSRDSALSPPAGTVGALTFTHWVLAEWIRAVRMGTDAPVRDLTYGRLPPVIPVRYAHVESGRTLRWSDERYDIFSDELINRSLMQPMAPGPVRDMIGEAFGQITWGRLGAVVYDHIKRGDSAKFYGDDSGALFAYATACELAIVNHTLALAWEDGTSAIDAAHFYRDMSVTKMLTSLCHRLGGSWSVDKPGFAFDWRVRIAEVRNRMIHSGFRPTQEEVESARRALEGIMTTLPKQLVGKWKKYPNTVSLLVSRGSVDLYASKKAHDTIVELIEANSHTAETEFSIWRSAYFAAG